MSEVSFLCIGDIVGSPGRSILKKNLARIQEQYEIDFSIANLENSAAGSGITVKIYKELRSYNIQAFTSGNHVYRKREVMNRFSEMDTLVRPLNFPKGSPGVGIRLFEFQDKTVAVVNLIGRVFMGLSDCPFQTIDAQIASLKEQADMIIVDFHTEATSEAMAMGWYLDGRVSVVFGTHTHVMTADERVLPRGTAFITDIGMCGSEAGVLGVEREPIVQRFIDQLPTNFKPSEELPYCFNAIKVVIDSQSGKAKSIERIYERLYDR